MVSNIPIWRRSWCNGYRRRKWTRWHEFKSWTRLIAFHIALMPLGKVWIQLFSLQLVDRLGSPALVRQLVKERENSEFKPVKLRLKMTLCHILPERRGWVNIYRIFQSNTNQYSKRVVWVRDWTLRVLSLWIRLDQVAMAMKWVFQISQSIRAGISSLYKTLLRSHSD